MEHTFSSIGADTTRSQIHQTDFPDFIGNFALGVGQVSKQHVVVDIHAGTNRITEKLFRTGAKVIALDQRKALGPAPAKGRAVKRRLSPGTDDPGLELPVEPRSVDIVFLDLVLQFVRTPAEAILQIKRILKPGGRLVITDIGKCSGGQSLENPGDRRPGLYPGDIRHWLKSAGFSNIIVNPVPTRPYGSDSPQSGSNRPTGYVMATATV